MTFDGKAFGAEVVAVVKDYLVKETKPLIDRIVELEKTVRELPTPVDHSPRIEALRDELDLLKRIEPAAAPELPDVEGIVRDCIDASIRSLDIAQQIDNAVQRAFDAQDFPEPKCLTIDDVQQSIRDEVKSLVETSITQDIKRVVDERVASLDVVKLVESAVAESIAAIPLPQDGKSVHVEDVRPIVIDEVAKRVAAMPVVKDGDPGKDGVGLAGAFIDRDGHLVITTSNGEAKNLGPVVGKDGDPGHDGFSLENFDATLQEDGRTILLSFSGNSHDYAVELAIPAMIYRGVWREQAYAKGDTVTWGGSLWHCDVDENSEKPGDGSKNWTLAAKRGRDGRDAAGDSKQALTSIRVGVPSKEPK